MQITINYYYASSHPALTPHFPLDYYAFLQSSVSNLYFTGLCMNLNVKNSTNSSRQYRHVNIGIGSLCTLGLFVPEIILANSKPGVQVLAESKQRSSSGNINAPGK
jgi:hypothetical protein